MPSEIAFRELSNYIALNVVAARMGFHGMHSEQVAIQDIPEGNLV